MNAKTKKYLLIGGVVVIAGFIAYKMWKKTTSSTSDKTLEEQTQAAKTQGQKALQKPFSKINKKPKN